MAEQWRPKSTGARGQEDQHVRVVFPGSHRSWADWIAHRLDSHDVPVSRTRWDPSREQPLEEALEDLLSSSGRVLLVLSDWFFQIGPRPMAEWSKVLREFVAGHSDRFAAVNLSNRGLLTAATVLDPVDLWGVGEEEAERRLLAQLGVRPLPQARQHSRPPGPRYPNDPVPVWGQLPHRNAEFTGRDELLNDLQQQLSDAGQGVAVRALVGSSGVGKTHIAAEYAYRFSPDYDIVWWVNSEQGNTLRDRLGELAVQLGLPGGSTAVERIRALHEALRRGDPYKRWLLVFDGWEELEEVAENLPRGGSGHVLITSRNREWSRYAELFEIPNFQRGESISYLMRRAQGLGPPDADRIAEEFGDVPIQLAQTAAYLSETGLEAAEYLRRVHEPASGGRRALPLVGKYAFGTVNAWAMTLNKLQSTEPRARQVLALCCAFAPGRIPIGLVDGLSADDLPEQLKWISTNRAAWARSLDALVKYSVLTRELRFTVAGGGGASGDGDVSVAQESVLMHGLAHNIVGELLRYDDDPETYRQVVRSLLAEADPGTPEDSRSWPRYAELLPHLVTSGLLASDAPRAHSLLLNCLHYCRAGGESRAGTELAEQIREQWALIMEPDAPSMMHLTTIQGTLLRADGRFREAFALDSERLELLRGADQADEEALMNAAGCLAADQRFLGRYSEALQQQREVLSTAEQLFGPEESITLLAHHNLGVGLRLLGRYKEAYDNDLGTFRKRESHLGPSHRDTLASGNVCARDLRLMGRYQEAVARQELGVRRHRGRLGDDHPKTLWARHNLVLCEWRAGTAKQDTGAVLATLLEQLARVNGREHYSTLALINDYGNYQRVHGDLAEAQELITEAENGYRALLGQAHPIPTGMQTNIGLILQAEGDRDGARNMFAQALAGLTSLLGDDHPVTIGCALNAAGGRNFTGHVEEAAELSRDTLRRAKNVLGHEHPLTLSCQIALAADLRAVREGEEAGKLEEDALQTLARTLGPQHPHARSARQRVRPYWDFEAYVG